MFYLVTKDVFSIEFLVDDTDYVFEKIQQR